MIFSRNPARGSRVLNALALLGVTTILGLAFAWQFAYDEPPCPLCLLQRVAFMLAGVGLLLNLRLGPSPMHYAMTIAASLGGMVAAGRQVLLHIAPGDPGYGTPFLGLHFYTWAFIAFSVLIVFCVLMLSVDRKWGDNMLKRPVSALGVIIMALFFIMVLANLGSTTLQCGFGPCPDNPTGYLWLGSGNTP
ncbi:disulfide bond formation protein B [Achromobacter sp. SIMBA_011]|jgi:disulfide bond formation protein DsbB|uniref:Disulfide bond formation protein B n=1 Tax=Achromobacter dolens TaxID=1287738 RepID=A0A6S7D0N9_9BURK|nr:MULTISPECIES: disulfide bond formation protein B [Achromobacter]MBK1981825.1 disulfide bond formation protein B [Achromobacter xylosoxidans]MCZ8409850.1 disulfide bond formation protein B [Achromobacter dolens]CAB3655830.1 Disulfide bond formation protein B [Achromobacter dolens]CAB3827392.1 Disulfide bond formation protein B [Achromobacter dolens]CAB3870425.1 Disulfide bond formation protein B [Achromobacter dolens]